MNLVTVISTSVEGAKRFIKVLRFGKSDVQTPRESAPYGIDGNPIKDMIAIYAETGQKGKPVIVGYINKNQKALVGELRLFSTDDSGTEKNYIWIRNNGNIEIGGNADNMVRYSKLAKAFNDLKQYHNTAVSSYNAFCSAVSLLTGIPFTAVIPSAADISPAKIDEIKTSSSS